MVSVVLSRLFILTCGTLYPGYRSYKAIRTKNVKEYVKWMMYWVVFACFLFLEALADIFVSFWCPFYYELKILFVIWLLSPYTRGASFLYRRVVHPTLTRHEPEIDDYIEKAKTEGIDYARELSKKGIEYAKEVVAQVAIRSQSHLVNQLAGRKSLSMNDLTDAGITDDDAPASLRRRAVPQKKRPGLPVVEETRSLRSADADENAIVDDAVVEETEEILYEEGYYDENGGLVVEREFKFLEGTTGAAGSLRVRAPRQSGRPSVMPSDLPPLPSGGFSTLPRSSSGARATRRQKY